MTEFLCTVVQIPVVEIQHWLYLPGGTRQGGQPNQDKPGGNRQGGQPNQDKPGGTNFFWLPSPHRINLEEPVRVASPTRINLEEPARVAQHNQDTLALRGLEELFLKLCCCVSFLFWREIDFGFTYYLCT